MHGKEASEEARAKAAIEARYAEEERIEEEAERARIATRARIDRDGFDFRFECFPADPNAVAFFNDFG